MRKYVIAKIILAAMALFGMALPLWALSFNVPSLGKEWQTITVYGTGSVQGPLDQINKANQFVGLEQIRPADILGLKLVPLIYVFAATFVVLGGRRMSFRKATLLYLLLLLSVPVGIQYWLHGFGHNMSPDATIALDPFTPYVVGTYEVATYVITTYFHVGYYLLLGILVVMLLVDKKWGK